MLPQRTLKWKSVWGAKNRYRRKAMLAELRAVPRFVSQVLPWMLRAGWGRADTLLDFALKHAESNPEGVAFQIRSRSWTWKQLADATSRIAYVLRDAGVRRGDIIALYGPNAPFYLAVVLGATRIGARTALLNTQLRGSQLARALRSSQAKVALCDQSLERTLRNCDNLSDIISKLLVYGGGTMDTLLEHAPGSPYPSIQSEPNEDFVYIYTSGTTGLPKPCRITHMRATLAAASFGALMFEYQEDDRLYCPLPLYHASGLLLGAGSAIIAGVPVALRENFSASDYWNDVHRYRSTCIMYIGEMCRYLVDAPPNPLDLSHDVRVAVGNGLRSDVWQRFQERFEIPKIREFYGATEAPGLIMNLSGKHGSVGRVPFNGLGWLRLVRYDIERDEHLRNARGHCIECDDNEAGELLIRLGYDSLYALGYTGYTDPDATEAKIMRDVFEKGDSYFRTGDLLRQDSEGFYYFVDRIGDTFRWNGHNVSTTEVTEVIAQCPSISSASVVGVSVPHHEGQAGLAAVVPTGDFDPVALWKAISELPGYAQPRFIRVCTKIATTTTFKIQKQRLKKEGIDPNKIDDPMYLWQSDGYVPYDVALWSKLERGEIRL